MYCSKCGSLMYPREGKLVCRRCGWVQKKSALESMRGTCKEKELKIIREEETLPQTSVECPDCGNTKAYWRLRQLRAADEPETRIYRCARCGHTWRESA